MRKTIRSLFTSILAAAFLSHAPSLHAGPADLDTTFNGTGKVITQVGTNAYGKGVAVQADGKVLVAGYSSNGTNNDFALVRYNPDGTLDTTFNGTGKVTTAIGAGDDFGRRVAVQADGKILVAGDYVLGSQSHFALVRYNSDGSLDTTFNTTGKLTTTVGTADDFCYGLALQGDGKILAAGSAVLGGKTDFALVRYNTDGSLDTTFNGTGKVIVAVGPSSEAGNDVAVQGDGKIVVAGYVFTGTMNDFGLARFNADGSLDATFNGTGKVTTAIGASNGTGQNVAVQGDGRILVSGFCSNGTNYDFALARYNSNGTLDTTFNGTGKATTAIGASDEFCWGMAVQADGKIILAGEANLSGNSDFAVARYNPDGSLDVTFNGTGKVTTATTLNQDEGYGVAVQADGKILVAGASTTSGFNNGFAVVRYQGVVTPAAPLVTVGAASGITINGATLNGTVNPNGVATTAQFEYGLTTTYGSTAAVSLSPNNGTTAQTVSANLAGLTGGTPYHYRLTATNGGGTFVTGDGTFTTLSTVPSVTVTPTGTTSGSSPINFTLTFSEPVTGLTAAGITVTNGTKGTLTGSGATYTIPVTPSAQGAVTCRVIAGAAVNSVSIGNAASNVASVIYDAVAPSVTVTPLITTTSVSPITFTFTFSEPVTGLTAAGIAVTNGTKGTLTGSGTTYTIPVTPSAQGVVTCQVIAGAATDAAGNGNTASFNASVTYDSIAPTVTVTPSGGSTSISPIVFILTFSESVTTPTAANITVTNGTKGALGTLPGNGTTYALPVTPSAAGTVTCRVTVGAAQDAAGNNSIASNTASVTYNNSGPVALTPGNILITRTNAHQVVEYTPTGTPVQAFNIPSPGGGTETLRDAVVGANGSVYLYNGTFTPAVTTLVPSTGTTSDRTYPGFSTINTTTYGGIATLGSFVFATDMQTGSGAEQLKGIIRFDLTAGTATRFADTAEYRQLTMGGDGFLYALPDPSSGTARIDVFDPFTLTLTRSIAFNLTLRMADIRALAVNYDGSIYAAAWNGSIYSLDSAGNILNSLNPGAGSLADINLDSSGRLVVSNTSGRVIITTTALTGQTSFTDPSGGSLFVAWNRDIIPIIRNADLSNLTVSAGALTPAFASATTSYTDSVPNATTSITVTSTLTDPNATVKVNGVTVASGTASGAIGLNVGANVITTVVTAEDLTTTKTYTLTVTRAPSSNADLSGLAVSAGMLAPAFASGTTGYTNNVPNSITSITLTPTVADATATANVNGANVASGAASAPISLAVGTNVITTMITAQDGVATKTYTLTVTRAPSSNADLSGLTVSAGTLTPAFAAGTTGYADSVSNAISSITLTPTVADATATVKVNGVTVASGAASAPISLSVGNNFITTVVTAQDLTTKTYLLTVARAPSSNADLSNFALSTGTLSPAFAPGTMDYTGSVPNSTASITVTPTLADTTATVRVNLIPVASGTASGPISLSVGTNLITAALIAQDGVTTKTYTFIITRAASSNANLSGFAMSDGTLSPVFSSTTTGYSASVPNGTAWLYVTPSVEDATARVKVNGIAVNSGTASAPIALGVGANTITTVVTAQDLTTKTYTLTVTRAPSSNADLSNLVLSTGTPGFVFVPGTTSYAQTVPYSMPILTVTPTVAEANATVKVNGVAVASGTASAPIALNVGANTITTVVNAQDLTTKTYTVTITRAPSSNADLSNLVLSAGTTGYLFSPSTTSYTETVANQTASISVMPTVTDANAAVKVNGVTVASGAASASIALNVGTNTITAVVTAQDLTTTKTYTVTVSRAPSSNPDLANLTVSAGALTPVFNSGATAYADSVPNATNSITVTPLVADSAATVKVNGTAVASGTASAPIALSVGANTITTIVTAQDLTTTQTYRVTVTRAQSSNADLANLTVSAGTLTPAFAAGTTAYADRVPNATTSISVTPLVADSTATVKVNGTAVASGTTSAPISLVVGSNAINTVVTAQNGTTKSYTITVTRATPPNIAGTYNGLATPSASATNPSRQVGLSDVTITSTGSFTGKIALGGATTTYPFSGTFNASSGGAANFGGSPTLTITRTGLPALSLALNLVVQDPLTHQITGTLTENSVIVSALVLDRYLYTDVAAPVAPLMNVPTSVRNPVTDNGAYTGIFQSLTPAAQGLPLASFPQGDGWLTATVSAKGAVTFSGKLGDGQTVTYTSYLSKDNRVPFYLSAYSGTGTVAGMISFRDVPAQSDADGLALRWYKPANSSDTSYRSGWPNGITVYFLGSKFLPSSISGKTILGNNPVATPTINALLELSDGSLTTLLDNRLSISAANLATIFGAPTGGTAAQLLSVTLSANGTFTGSFRHPVSNKTTTFAGVVMQKTQTASGYFMGLPSTGTITQSGSVTISPQ